MILYFIVFGLYFILFLISRKEKVLKRQHQLLKPFAKAASFLMNSQVMDKILSMHVCENLKILFGKENLKEKIDNYYCQKITLILTVFFLGIIFLFLIDLKNKENSYLYNENQIKRSGYDGEEQLLKLTASSNQHKENIEVLVAPIQYTEEEAKEIFEEVKDEVIKQLTASTETLSNIQSDLHFMNQSSKYPVEINFESNNDAVVDTDGTVHNEELNEETVVMLTITLTYREFRKEYEIPVLVFPKEYTKEQLFSRSVQKRINAIEKKQKTDTYLTLPDKVENTEIKYEEIKGNPAGSLLFILIVTVSLLYIKKDKELVKQVQKRKKELQSEYPEFISKFTLLIGAGMPIKASLIRLAYDYKKKRDSGAKRRLVYEELLQTIHEMESGMIEELAYESFGKRCQEVNYIKFSGLLMQNKKRGGKELIEQLEKEVKEAFEERKNQSRRLGEEAGTKLLVPMMIMLGIVMILVIIPAFLSYQI